MLWVASLHRSLRPNFFTRKVIELDEIKFLFFDRLLKLEFSQNYPPISEVLGSVGRTFFYLFLKKLLYFLENYPAIFEILG